jgi:tetratricopeptide (TPR) repeat protein
LILKSRYWSDGGDELAALGEAQMAIKSLANKNSTLAADAYARIAQCLFRLGRSKEAQDISFTALNVARQINDKHIEGVILNDLGTQADDEGDYDSAINYYNDALKLHKAVGNRNNEGGTLGNIGYALMMLGDYMSAYIQLKSASHIFSTIGHQLHHAITLINIGITELNMQHPARASEFALNAIEIISKINAKSTEAAAQRLIGQAELELGNLETARNRLLIAEQLFEELGLKHLARECIAHLACEALRRGAIAEGMMHVENVLQTENIASSFDGMEEPMRIAFICHEILARAKDIRATALITHTYHALKQRANRINGPARRVNYLEGVPYHRDIINAWENATKMAL